MDIFFTADTHLDHVNILKYTPRPFKTVEEMNEALVHAWNAKVGRKARVYIVGDFAFRRHAYWANRLNGHKTLILGSHDRASQEVYRTVFAEVPPLKMLEVGDNAYYMTHNCPRVWERSHYGSRALFGHSHGRLRTYNLSMDVGVDNAPDLAPFSVEEIEGIMDLRTAEMRRQDRIVQEGGKTLYRQDDVRWLLDRYGQPL